LIFSKTLRALWDNGGGGGEDDNRPFYAIIYQKEMFEWRYQLRYLKR